MTTDLVRANRIPSDWGLEVGVLAEVYRNCSIKRVCQVDIVDNYDHKHQDLSENDSTRGLHRMVRDIAASLIRNLASYGIEFDAGFLNTMIAAYVRTAQDAIARYSDDAALNGLRFDRHAEEVAVETFSGALRAAASTSCATRWGRLRSRTGVASYRLSPASSINCARPSTPTQGTRPVAATSVRAPGVANPRAEEM